jgi:hypothetical protein
MLISFIKSQIKTLENTHKNNNTFKFKKQFNFTKKIY